MSIRTDHNSTDASYAGAVRKDLETLKQTAVEAARLDAVDPSYRPTSAEAAAAYDSLHPVEQSAANLGVEPGALRPIGFMNAAHYDSLKKSNALSEDLSRRIEAYKVVASASE